MDDGLLVGIDAGGTKILAVAVDRREPRRVLARHVVPTPDTADAFVTAVVEIARTVGVVGRLGVGLPGLVDAEGVLRAAPHLGALVDTPIADVVARALGIGHVAIDNDANCALRAEMAIGVARGCDDVVLVTFGTGIGGAIAIGGVVRSGAHGFAGEPGHMLVDPAGPLCPCGRRGCWERYASGTGMVALAAAAGLSVAAGEEVVALARHGDPVATAVVDRFARWVGEGLASLADILDPALMVIGGGLSADADLWIDTVRATVATETLGGACRSVPVEVAQAGPEAGAIGAALLAGERNP